jgi:hypothetical protein
MRIALQCLLNQKRQGPESAAHIGVAGRKPNPYVARDRNHRRSSTSRTRAKAAASTFASTRTRRPPPRLISISPLRPEVAGRDWGRSSHDGFVISATGPGPAIRTAANRGAIVGGPPVRACRRQVKTRLAEMPLRRATSDTFAPGTSVSSRIRIFSSDDHRRRRSTPPRTSTRIGRP